MLTGVRRVGLLLAKTIRDLWANDVLGLAAQTSYFLFYSLFPILLFSVPLLSLAGDRQQTFLSLATRLGSAAPPEAVALIQTALHDVVFVRAAPSLISVGGLIALWAGVSVFSSLINAFNRAGAVHETRPWWRTTLLSLAFVVGGGLTMMTATIVLLFGHALVRTAANAVGLGTSAIAIWSVGQEVIAVALVVAVGSVTFRVLPNQRVSWRQATIGSVAATVLWLVATAGFRVYVAHFSNYNKAYGSIGAVIVLLSWIYLSMVSVLFGAELAFELAGPALPPRPRAAAR
jgi:membrane protein